MRYLKVFFLVVLFFLVIMFFVQNQASFSDPVTLKFDPMFAPAVTSIPLPRYALMLICFAIGAAVVLLMLLWDRVTLCSRLSASRRRNASLKKQLAAVTAEKEKLIEAIKAAEAEAAARAEQEKAQAKAAEQAAPAPAE